MHRDGKIGIQSTVEVADRAALAMAYTPGVARVCSAIAGQPELASEYTWVGNTVAVVSDGTAVLGLGDIGPAAAMPVMEGKALLFKRFAGINAVPVRSEEHTSELQSRRDLVCRLLLEKKKKINENRC